MPGGPTYLVEYNSDDEEDDCTPLIGIKSSYDFIFTEQIGTVKHRKRPCFCEKCLLWKFEECHNQFVTGQLTEGKLKYKAIQADSTEEYEVQDLLERRQGDNGPEFLVKWAGWSDQYNEWLPEAALDCPDLMKKWK